MQVNAPLTEKTWARGWVVLAVKRKNGRTVGGAFYSFHDELLSKNIARRQLDGQHLLFGVYLQTWITLYLLNMHYRGELNIDEVKYVLACFWTRNYFEWIIKQLMNSAFVRYKELCRSRRVLSTSADNALLDLHNSSYPTQPYSLIAN